MLRPPPDTIPSTTLRPETGTPSCIAASQSSAFHEKAGMSQVCFFLFSFFFLWIPSVRAGPPLSPSFHPHSWLSDCRSVHGGRSQFSRCCYLIIDLCFPLSKETGPGTGAVT